MKHASSSSDLSDTEKKALEEKSDGSRGNPKAVKHDDHSKKNEPGNPLFNHLTVEEHETKDPPSRFDLSDTIRKYTSRVSTAVSIIVTHSGCTHQISQHLSQKK